MNIVFCSDNNYAMPAGVAIKSLLYNNTQNTLTIHFIGNGLTEDTKDKLQEIVGDYPNATLKLYEISEEKLKDYKFPIESSYLSLSTYIRLFIVDILPTEIKKIIYLDCDLIVLRDLQGFYDENIENYPIGAVVDMPMKKQINYVLNRDVNTYVNAGVLLINLEYWREHKTQSVILNFMDKNKDILHFEDQDAINGALYKNIKLLSLKYNMLLNFFKRDAMLYKRDSELKEAIRKPTIVHFCGSAKPWNKGCLQPYREDFEYYKSLTPWAGVEKTWDNTKSSQKRRYYKRIILDKLGLKKLKFIQKKELK